MELKAFLKGSSVEEKNSFAESVKTTGGYLNLLIYNQRKPSAPLALRIEQATGGAVTLRELLFPKEAAK